MQCIFSAKEVTERSEYAGARVERSSLGGTQAFVMKLSAVPILGVLVAVLLTTVLASAQLLYRNPAFGVKNTTNVLYAQGLTCTSR